jgi:NitT/TauT family transport system ATP-binding protein
MSNVLKIRNLSKTYYSLNGEVKAIDSFSLDVNDGDYISIIGSSGCGKSTLLNILSSLDKDYDGDIKFRDNNVKVGYMLQEDTLFDWLTIYENSILGLKIKHILTKDNIKYVKDLLIKYGLKDFMNKYPKSLSGGMRQRVALIRTLAIKPDILLLDEPFSALDYQTRLKVSDDVYKIIKEENKTVIMVTHDIAEAISMSDKVVVLSKRPCKIKNIYDVELENKSTPINNRKAKEFTHYYDLLWRDLDEIVS